ncbi:MAG: HEAT repeat domain-containing protein [Kofleriaceae bacterium]
MKLALWAAGIATAFAIIAILVVAGRHLLTVWRDRRLLVQAKRVRAALDEARTREFDGLDKMLFDMRESYSADVIERELSSTLSPDANAPKLVQAFAVLGITDRYLLAVRAARSWQDRARAATTLGLLGELRAVKPLIEGMRDPHEDADVKLACAEALGQIRSPDVLPLLVGELEHLDDWSSPRIAAVLIRFGDLAVEPLITALNSASNLNVRVWAAQVIGKLGDARAVPSLLARIHDRSDALRTSVANALGDLHDARAVRALIDSVLRDPSATVRAQAAAALGRIGDITALPQLVAALGDPEHWVRLRALEAIEAVTPEDTSALEVALDDPNRDVRFRAALALDRLGMLEQAFVDLGGDDDLRRIAAQDRLVAVGRAGLSERFIGHFEDPNPRVRARIVAVLGAVANPAHTPALVKRLGDGDPAVRTEAIAALAAIGNEATATALIPVMRDAAPAETAAATAALLRHESHTLAAIHAQLTPLLAHQRDDVRAATIQLLALVLGEPIDDQLRAALSDRFVEARLAALRALGSRRVVAAVDEIGEALQSPIGALRIAGAEALGAIGGPRAVQLLVAAMPNAFDEFRDAVCAALAGFGWDAVYPTFDVLLASEEVTARLGLVWTLGKTGDPRAIRFLKMLLRETEPTIRSAAAGALGKFADPSATIVVAEAVADPSPFVRAAVARSLGLLRAPVDVVAPMLVDPDGFVRNRAALALGKIGGASADAVLAATAPSSLARAVLVMARGLTGTDAGIAATLQAIQQPALLRELNTLLSEEPPALQAQLRAHLGLDGPSAPAELELDAVVEGYLETLRNSPEVEARRTAVHAIGALSSADAIAALAAAVRDDPDHEVRCRAAARLGRRYDAHAKAALLGALHDPDSRVRIAAIRGLGHDLTPRDAAPLFVALTSPEPEVVAGAEHALTTIFSDPNALPDLEDWMMAQEFEPLICSGLRILGAVADSRSLRAIQGQTRSTAAAIRIEAIRALAALNVPAAIHAVLGALEDPVVAVRVAAVHALRNTTRADVFDRLARAVADPSPDVRLELCAALVASRTGEPAPVLAQLAVDRDSAVCAAAVSSLLALPDLEGLQRVATLLPSLPVDVRSAVRGSSAAVVTRLAAVMVSALDPGTRELAVRVLSSLDATAHAELISRALDDPDGRVRLAAVQALAELDYERVGDWLARVHDDPVSDVRTAARRRPWRLV